MDETDKSIVCGKMQIYPVSRTVYVDQYEIVLTRMEFDVLFFLASNPNIAFTKEQIYEAVSGDDYAEVSYTIRDIIYRLRAKLEINNIRTLYGFGYKFNANS